MEMYGVFWKVAVEGEYGRICWGSHLRDPIKLVKVALSKL